MIGINVVRKWFLAPPIGGSGALLLGISAVVLPTLVRAIAQPVVTGIPLETYVPFILLSAIALDWRHAAIVAVVSALVGSTLFIEPRFVFLAGPTDIFAILIFLVGSAMIIKFVHEVRGIVVEAPGSRAAKHRPGIVFSCESGDAWASWQGHNCTVRLGSQDEVAAMMEDFLAQRQLGKTLAK